MSKLDDVRALFPVGGRVQCVENTYIPDRAGVVLEIKRSGKSYCDGRVVDVAADPRLKSDTAFRCSLPTRVSDVLHVDETTATYLIDPKLPRLCGHTVTYRRVEESTACSL